MIDDLECTIWSVRQKGWACTHATSIYWRTLSKPGDQFGSTRWGGSGILMDVQSILRMNIGVVNHQFLPSGSSGQRVERSQLGYRPPAPEAVRPVSIRGFSGFNMSAALS